MSDELLKRAFEYIRAGKNSIVFLSDDTVIEALEKLGAEHQDACKYHIVGCYECGAEGELTSSCNARVNIPKALEVVLNDGKDVFTGISLMDVNTQEIDSFDALLSHFKKALLEFTERAISSTNDWEKAYYKLHASPFLSATYPSSIEKAGDLYCNYTAKYNNSSLNAIGLATAVDALAAIRRLVFEDKKYTLVEFAEILKNNWEGNEKLRLIAKNIPEKYGNNNAVADEITKDITDYCASIINNKPNSRGGVFKAALFSIDFFVELS
jgi:formate C-acetyltransferase